MNAGERQFVVIGGSSGIGLEIVRSLATTGNVRATYNSTTPVPIQGADFHPFDVLDPSAPIEFLPPAIHGLVYCPGSIDLVPFNRIRSADMDRDLALNVAGAVRILQAALPALKASQGSVVLFSTVAVQQGFPFHARVAMAKGALEGLVRALAAEWAPDVRVNAIAPSLTDTRLAAKLLANEDRRKAQADKHPAKRLGNASDHAEMAAFLLSPAASWITGQIIPVDGGLSRLRT